VWWHAPPLHSPASCGRDVREYSDGVAPYGDVSIEALGEDREAASPAALLPAMVPWRSSPPVAALRCVSAPYPIVVTLSQTSTTPPGALVTVAVGGEQEGSGVGGGHRLWGGDGMQLGGRWVGAEVFRGSRCARWPRQKTPSRISY